MQGVLCTNYDRPTSAALLTGRQRRRSIYRDPKLCCGKSVVSHNTTYCCVVSCHNTTICCVAENVFSTTQHIVVLWLHLYVGWHLWATVCLHIICWHQFEGREMLICKHWTSNSQTSATTTCLVDSMHKLWFLLRFCAVYYCSFCIPYLLEYYLSCLQNLVYIEHSCTCSGGKPADTYSDVTLHCWQK